MQKLAAIFAGLVMTAIPVFAHHAFTAPVSVNSSNTKSPRIEESSSATPPQLAGWKLKEGHVAMLSVDVGFTETENLDQKMIGSMKRGSSSP